MLISDKKAMGLSGMCILQLALTFELGVVPASGELVGCVYGSDPRISGMVRERRKAGMDTLKTILEKADGLALSEHIAKVVRALSDDGLVTQAQLVTRFWNNVQEYCISNPPAVFKFIRIYLDK